jgi:hypothetical protein
LRRARETDALRLRAFAVVTAAFSWLLQIWRANGHAFCAMQRKAFSLDIA